MTGTPMSHGPSAVLAPWAVKVIAIIGGSGSGKTTLARAVCEALLPRIDGGTVAILAEDDYYFDSRNLEGFDPASYNFDVPQAKDFNQLAADLSVLRSGRTCQTPDYDHKVHRRRDTSKTLSASRFILLEGMHALQMLAAQNLIDLSIYLHTPDDVRLARRLMRDIAPEALEGRGRTPEGVVQQYFRTVRAGQIRHVEPQRAMADLVLADDNPPPSLGGVAVDGRTNTLCAAVLALMEEKGLLPPARAI